MKIAYTLATAADAARIAVMSRDLIETGLGWSWTPERIARSIRNRDTVTLVARDRGRLVGFAIMFFGDEHAHLNLLAVRREYQRTGVGRCMLAWLEESALTAGIGVISLELRASNRDARRFYRALGFQETRYIPCYYRGRETAVRMERDIRRSSTSRTGEPPRLGSDGEGPAADRK